MAHASRSFTYAILVAMLGSAAIGGCETSGSAQSQVSSPSIGVGALPSPTHADIDGGAITLTDDGCTWEANPGAMPEGRLEVEVRNETDDYGVFILHRLHPGRTFDDGRLAIAEIQEALISGAEWPAEVSEAITEATAEGGLKSELSILSTAGTYGVVCSANTSPTGDILTILLVGPLVVTRP